ncbi:hypothetical protein [Streptomyces sp. NPDC002994]|uniref:hypothetical protein n=1 Tax=Streptomyces sp. NPDC002994 TaxID=3154441 RepID=UPI0033B45CFE
MKTGPQKYPGASTTYWYQTRYGGTPMESNVGVVHTTEGRVLPSYGDGASAPNFTAVPDFANKRLRWYQHFDFDVSSRALVNRSGGVDTNTANAVQVELVGTCDERNATTWDGKRAGVDYTFWPDAPDWALKELAHFVRWAHAEHGLQMKSTITWKPYNKGQVGGSYGANGVRLTGAQWGSYYGWLGHQHVPENDHGDPGDIDFARVLAHATAKPTTPTAPAEEDTDVPHNLSLTDQRDKPLIPGKWTSVAVESLDLLKDAKAYTATAWLNLTAPEGGTVQGRWYHHRPDGSRWAGPITERTTTGGGSFLDFSHVGSVDPGEVVRFEAVYYPADDADLKSTLITTARVRGLYWK